jgi:hypothetical protein
LRCLLLFGPALARHRFRFPFTKRVQKRDRPFFHMPFLKLLLYHTQQRP